MSEFVVTPASGDAWLAVRQRAYLLCGDDDQSILDAARSIQERFLEEDAADFDLDDLDAETTPIEDIIGSIQREPLLGDVRMVVVRAAGILRRRDKARSADLLADAIRQLGPRSCLVLIKRPTGEVTRKGAAILTAKLDSAVRDVGAIVRCPALDQEGMVRWIEQYVAQCGKSITKEAAHRLVARGSPDRIAVGHDLDRLIAYIGSRKRIEASDVHALVAQDPEDVMFRLVDAISSRRTGEALMLLRAASRYETRPHALAGRFLALVERQLRLLYQARELRSLGVGMSELRTLPQEIAADLPNDASIVSMSWRASSYARDAAQWTRAELVQAFGLLVQCDAANKGDEAGHENPLANLEQLVILLCDRSLAMGRTTTDLPLRGQV